MLKFRIDSPGWPKITFIHQNLVNVKGIACGNGQLGKGAAQVRGTTRVLDPAKGEVRSKGALLSGEPQGLKSPFQPGLKSTQAFHIPLKPRPNNPWPPRIGEGSKTTEAKAERWFSLDHSGRRHGNGLYLLGADIAQKF